MKRYLLPLFAWSVLLATASQVMGQGQPKSAPAAKAPAQPQPQKLVRVATLNSIAANREFQDNVQLLQAQRQAAIDLTASMDREKDPKKKAELKKQLDELMARLNDNNAKMQKTYGFSLNRNYHMVVEKSHIYMFVTDEEAAKVDQAEKAEQAKKGKAGRK